MNKEDRKEDLILSALSLFIEKGYKGTTTVEIARVANISEVTLFRHFRSKEELFMACVQPVLKASLEMMKVDDLNISFKDQLKVALVNRIIYITKHHEVIKLILNEQVLLSDYPNLMEEMVNDLQETLLTYGLKENIEAKQRLLMGMFLSYLYHPETNLLTIETYVDWIFSQWIES